MKILAQKVQRKAMAKRNDTIISERLFNATAFIFCRGGRPQPHRAGLPLMVVAGLAAPHPHPNLGAWVPNKTWPRH